MLIATNQLLLLLLRVLLSIANGQLVKAKLLKLVGISSVCFCQITIDGYGIQQHIHIMCVMIVLMRDLFELWGINLSQLVQ